MYLYTPRDDASDVLWVGFFVMRDCALEFVGVCDGKTALLILVLPRIDVIATKIATYCLLPKFAPNAWIIGGMKYMYARTSYWDER